MSGPLTVVLGASGLIGSAVAARLARRTGRLRLVARRTPVVPDGATAEVETVRADLTAEPGTLAAAVADADTVVHLLARRTADGSWRIPEGDAHARRVNLGLLRETLAAVRRRPTVVFASSTGASAEGTAYDRYKRAAEDDLRAASSAGTVTGVTLRFPTVFGPPAAPGGTDHGVVSAMARRALAAKPLPLWHAGLVRRDLLYVDDAARALLAALDHAPALAGRAWPVSGAPAELGQVFTTLASLAAERTNTPPVPVVREAPAGGGAVAADFLDLTVDDTEFRGTSGWRPHTTLHAALRHTVAALAEPALAEPAPPEPANPQAEKEPP